MRSSALLVAVSFAMTGFASAQETITKTEKTVTRTGTGSAVTIQKTETTTYQTRTETAYRTVGIPQDVIVKLRDYDTRIIEARRAGDIGRVRTYWTEQRRLLTPDQIEKVRVYLREHPVTDKTFITTWEEEPVVTREVRTEVREPESETTVKTTVEKETVPTTVKTEEVRVKTTTE